LRRVTQDFESRWHFNTSVALIMELMNALQAAEPLDQDARPEVVKEALESLTLMLAPMAPHLAERALAYAWAQRRIEQRPLARIRPATRRGRAGRDRLPD